jgi:hypothetical protein
MRCAASLQSLKLQRIFLGGMPPRSGSAMCRVALEGMARSVRVEAGVERCLPACTRRRSVAGRLWRRARREARVAIEVEEGIVRGMAGGVLACVSCMNSRRLDHKRADVLLVPETLLTKICMVSSSEDMELMLLMLLERRIVAVVFVACG